MEKGRTIFERLEKLEDEVRKLRDGLRDAEDDKRNESYDNEMGTHEFEASNAAANNLEAMAEYVNEAMLLLAAARRVEGSDYLNV